MGSNSFGKIFKITTFGESHGVAMGVVIDGCPAGLVLTEKDINKVLTLRQPGKNEFVTLRKEKDEAQILSGVFENKTTGAPIAILIKNTDADSSNYKAFKNLFRPGYADYTYLEKYGIFDYRGGGRASARETVCRVASGAVALKLLDKFGIKTAAYLKRVGEITAKFEYSDILKLRQKTYHNPIFCPDTKAAMLMMECIRTVKNSGDSIGWVVEFVVDGLPVGLGDPVYEKLSAKLASAMLSIPAVKGFEVGKGFSAAQMLGSEYNDELIKSDIKKTSFVSNHAGGLLGGISNGMPLIGRVAFRPAASIEKEQSTLDLQGKKNIFKLPTGSRHDPCVAVRAVPVVEAMCALVIVDALLLNRSTKL